MSYVVDTLTSQERTYSLAATGKERLRLRLPFNRAARLLQVEYHLNPSGTGTDQYVGVGISKLAEDWVRTPTSFTSIQDDPNVIARWTHQLIHDAGGGMAIGDIDRKIMFEEDSAPMLVLDPTIVGFMLNRTIVCILRFDVVKVSFETFTKLAIWQGGFK